LMAGEEEGEDGQNVEDKEEGTKEKKSRDW